LAEAATILPRYGFDMSQLPLILAVIRNPYAMEVSLYAFTRRPNNPQAGNPLGKLALSMEFNEYVIERYKRSDIHFMKHLDRYYTVDGTIPPNMRVVKFENLGQEVKTFLREIGVNGDSEFPWLNRSQHDDYMSYYTMEAEEAIYLQHKWVFDHGFYPRLNLAALRVTA